MDSTDFAIVDFETTGLYPEHSDRVIEVGVIRLSPDGQRLGEYTTLINPLEKIWSGAT